MSEFSDWADTQLRRAGFRPELGGDMQITYSTVMRMCREWGEINFPAIGEENTKRILALLSRLLNHQALPIQDDPFSWVPSRQLPPAVGSAVRVKLDAFDGPKGSQLNGREGIVEGARRGDFIVTFMDARQPEGARVIAAQLDTRVG
jgi:hypothetical protein